MIVNIISNVKGGGAETLVREIHSIYCDNNIESRCIYFEGDAADLKPGEVVLGVNPRNPLNIFIIRKILKRLSFCSDSKVVVHAHLTWPFVYVVMASLGVNNLRLIYTEHKTTNKRRKFTLLRWVERLFYARYDRVICISQGVYDSL